MPPECRAATSSKRARALGQAVSGGGANGTRAADDHVCNRAGGLTKAEGAHNPEFVRKKPLLAEEDRGAIWIKGDDRKKARAPTTSNIQAREVRVSATGCRGWSDEGRGERESE